MSHIIYKIYLLGYENIFLTNKQKSFSLQNYNYYLPIEIKIVSCKWEETVDLN